MKVLQINSVCGIGSTGRIATDIHQLLIEQGHESWIAYGRGEERNSDNVIKIGNDLDNYAHVAKTRILDRHGFGSKKATENFIEEIKKINPDIIHLHNIHGYYINIEILFNYLMKINKPVVWTLHDCWSFTGHCVHFEYVNCDKWKTGCFNCPQLQEYPSSLIVDNSNRNFKDKQKLFSSLENLTIITPSNWLGRLAEESFLKTTSIKVIKNGIDLSVFHPKPSSFREKYNIPNQILVLGVARWDKRKGLNYFIELSEKLDSRYQIVLVGVTEKQKKLLPKNIIGIKQTNNTNELVEIYSAADVFVNPTLEDNLPTTNLEAQACGTPVITFKTGGSEETVREETGIVINKGNLQELLLAVQSIKEKKKNPNLACVKWIENNFASFNRYSDYLNVYSERHINS